MPRQTRRTILKQGGAVILGLSLTTTTATAQEKQKNDDQVTRLRGSYESPVSLAETRNKLKQLVDESSAADQSVLAARAVPEFDSGSEIVEYVACIDPSGNLSQYYGAADAESVDDAHRKADTKETALPEQVTTQDTNTGPDWNYVGDYQANNSKEFGEIINNLEWYRNPDGDEEHNAFRSKMASIDNTSRDWNRKIHAKHDWGVSQLGNDDVHKTSPSTTDDIPVEISIGIPPSLQLSWSSRGSGSITHTLDTDGPTAEWTRDIPSSGMRWFDPGSHVVSDRASRGDEQDVMQLTATGEWIGEYLKGKDWVPKPRKEVGHTWNMFLSELYDR